MLTPAAHGLARALLGPSLFHRLRRGALERPPFTRLQGHVATRIKRHSKKRQNSCRNYFGRFLGQVKGQVTRGQRSSKVKFGLFQHYQQAYFR